jgi:predicted Co/Zn/Cd cation transporter (cation efflux family)
MIALAAALAAAAAAPILAGAATRLRDRAAREALTVYVDAVSLSLAALVVLVRPLGYVAAALLAWLLARVRARAGVRPGGLRITRG